MSEKMLFTPMKIGSCEIKNRIVMAPMLMGFGDFDGEPTDKMMNYYEERAKGGTGLIITEITRVNDKTGASAFAQLSVSSDKIIAPLREMADRIHKHGAKLFVQLHHPGRQNVGLMVGTVPLSIAAQRAFTEKFFIISLRNSDLHFSRKILFPRLLLLQNASRLISQAAECGRFLTRK